jgi:hypothetical protein
MVLWNSRLIHAGQECLKTREKENFRCVVYVCMVPRKLVDKKMQEKHKKAFTEKRLTNHNCIRMKLFAKNPRTYGNIMQVMTPVPEPILTELGKSLI